MYARSLIAALIVLSLTAGVAHATILPFETSWTFSSVGTKNVTLSQFNPALGTLNSVTMYVYGTGRATFAADNDYLDGGINVTAQMQHQWNATAPGVSLDGTDIWSNAQALGMGSGDGLGVFDPSPSDGYNWGTHTEGEYSALGSPVGVAPALWAAYQGVGNVMVGLNSQVFVSSITGSAAWYVPGTEYLLQTDVSDPSLNLRVRVVYDYTPSEPGVPEPCTLALLGIGAVGMGLRARRRKSA